jgi:ferrous-iron efflux pump FieF
MLASTIFRDRQIMQPALTPGENRTGQLMRWASIASVAVAASLVLAKLFAWIVTDSLAVMSSMIDSALDLGASLVNFFAVRHALMPADEEHRFGHGKAEAVAGLAQSAFIAGTALFLLFEAAHRFLSPRPVMKGEIGIAVMVLSIVMTLALVLFQLYVVRQTKSLAISADSLHYKGDLLANIAVIVALVLTMQLGWGFADPVFAVGVAIYIMYGSWTIARRALDQIMDRELPDDERDNIIAIARADTDVMDVHDLRTRSSGVQTFIQLHLELDGALTLTKAHEVADRVELAIQRNYPDAEVMIHQDPAGLEEEHPQFESSTS